MLAAAPGSSHQVSARKNRRRRRVLDLEPTISKYLTADSSSLPRLTPTERRIAELILQGMTPNLVAATLKRSPGTVKQHMWSIYEAFGLRENCKLVKLWLILHERRAEFGMRCQACGEM